MSPRWIKFWIIWTACLLPVVWSLYHDTGPELASGKPLAKIAKLEGNVTVRSEGRMIWQRATLGQQLYNNDLIATESKSRVLIQFYEGRKLQLSPESVVKLGLPTPMSKDFEISVLKGRLMVKPEEVPPPPKETSKDGMAAKRAPEAQPSSQLILRTANQQKVVITDTQKELVAENPKESPLATPRKDTDLSALASLSKIPVCPPTVIEPNPPLPAPIVEKEILKPNVPTFDPTLSPVIQPSGGEFWTLESLDSVAEQPIRLQIGLPAKRPKDKWAGIANISGNKGHIRIEGKSDSEQRKLSFTLKDLLASQVIPDLNRASFTVQTGYSLTSEEFEDPIEYLAPTTEVFNIQSLSAGDGILVGFDRVQTESSTSPWLFVRPKEGTRIQVGVTEKSDRKKLLDFVRGNEGKASLSNWVGLPSEGAFIIRGEKIVGTVLGKGISGQEWDRIRRAFDADLIYSGTSFAFIGGKNVNLDQLQSMTNRIFVYNKGQFVELDIGLLKSSPSTMKFVQGISSYIFREPTTILSQAR